MGSIAISIGDPGMTALHRAGLAGLYMTLQQLEKSRKNCGLNWALDKNKVELSWDGDFQPAFDRLFRSSFGVTNDGVLDFAAHRGHPMSERQRIFISEAIRTTFLQHNKQNRIPKGTTNRELVFDYQETQHAMKFKPFNSNYMHATAAMEKMFPKQPDEFIPIKGWLFPGAVERHSNLANTEIEENFARFLCLLYAPVAVLYLRIRRFSADGKFNARQNSAIVVPNIVQIDEYCESYQNYLGSPVENITVSGIYDAAMTALLLLKMTRSLDDIGVSGCTVYLMGQTVWAKQQQTRTSVVSISAESLSQTREFEVAWRCFSNKILSRPTNPDKENPQPKPHLLTIPSLCRGVIAENATLGAPFYKGFSQFGQGKKLFAKVLYERKELNAMLGEMRDTYKAECSFVEAIHVAIRNRLGKMAAEAAHRGETPRFDREFERLRTNLMRAKNAQTMRAEIADLFARGGINSGLQKNWEMVLTIMNGREWQMARDLALLGLASYVGRGAQEIVESANADTEEDEK